MTLDFDNTIADRKAFQQLIISMQKSIKEKTIRIYTKQNELEQVSNLVIYWNR